MASPCPFPYNDVDFETKALTTLLDIFHPRISLEEIASAYCEAGCDLDKASDILCQRQDENSSTTISERDYAANNAIPEESLNEDSTELLDQLNIKGSKVKMMSASIGSISSVIGKSYSRPISSKKEFAGPTKPLKVEVNSPMSNDVEVAPSRLDSVRNKQELCDMEDFLYAMLGDGFQLSRNVIREVLGHCGYDMKKGMEELLLLSAQALANGKPIDSASYKNCTGSLSKPQSCTPEDHHQRDLTKQSVLGNEKSNLSREVLLSLFSAPDISEEPKKCLQWGLNRTRVVGKTAVTEPPAEPIFLSLSKFGLTLKDTDIVINDDDDYKTLRRVAKEHWQNMKTSYKAAIDAFSEGNVSKANNLLEEGNNQFQMAREAEEQSAKLIIDSRDSEDQTDVPLDLQAHSAKEAVRMLKKHLHMLANLPMFRYLKVIVNADMEDTTKGKRKRMIIKLLEKESIEWTEDKDPGTILIELKQIDPAKLSFGSGLP